MYNKGGRNCLCSSALNYVYFLHRDIKNKAEGLMCNMERHSCRMWSFHEKIVLIMLWLFNVKMVLNYMMMCFIL